MSTDSPGRRGSVGEEIFEQVDRLVKDEGLTRTQAFERLSEQTGRRAGTVAANYYRVARQKGAPLQKRGRRAPGDGRRRARGGGDIESAVRRASEALDELAKAVRAQEKELTKLREQSAEFDKLRRWMDRNLD